MKVLLVTIQLITVQGIITTSYRRHAVCNLRDRINKACYTLDTAKTKLECASQCNSKPACMEFVFSLQDSSCYHHSSCSYTPSCSIFDSDLTLYILGARTMATSPPATTPPPETTTAPPQTTAALQETSAAPQETIAPLSKTSEALRETTNTQIKTTDSAFTVTVGDQCQNGGVSTGSECDCSGTGGKVGTFCEMNATACSDLQVYGYPDGNYLVTLDPNGDGSYTFDTYCSVQGASSYVELVRSSENYDTSMPFSIYQSGYKLGPNDFWIGLDPMVALTPSPRDLVFTIFYNSSEVQGNAWVKYKNVIFSKTNSGEYKVRQINVDFRFGYDFKPKNIDFSGMLPDPEVIEIYMSPIFVRFSEEGSPDTCADQLGRGWWYTNCGKTNPMGYNYKAYPGPTTQYHIRIPGVDMTKAMASDAFDYISLTLTG
ncbi:superoxide dismutase 1, soluble [latimeria chalumnae] [Plakobranchus ocellatus]|uniref:Superoxide dismutase 1, soluble [latimeria chalumnae] n=1 Tax=Plakobranchus ocellatus TaxID=259542 RepID=A0AAV4C315_9GAST|nr:superoxide dismutase 1, soluble [latimeria chalumnae] [Plakobranchus ocellatus]